MKYVYGKRRRFNRDWVVIALIFTVNALMISTAYFALQSYMRSGPAYRNCEVEQ